MTVTVERIWTGHGEYRFRLSIPMASGGTSREQIAGDEWTRKLAGEALDMLESVYRIERKTVRFRLLN